MMPLLLVWLGVCIAMMTVGGGDRHHSAGLPLAYFLNLSFIHVPGALAYLDAEDWEAMGIWTRLGFEQTVIGTVAFLLAVVVARHTGLASRHRKQLNNTQPSDLVALDRLGLYYFFGGLFCFMSLPSLGSIPSVGAIISSLKHLMIVGACLRIWVARKSASQRKFWQTIGLVPVLPLFTLVKEGFLASGASLLLSILAFVMSQSKRTRLSYYLIAPIVVFVGLSFFVNYMAARNELRVLFWYQQVGIEDRISRIARIFENFQWLDFSKSEHRNLVDARLNQNPLVGLAVTRLESGEVNYAYGETIGELVIGLIPRALWPEKPAVGGGGGVVQHFTGIKFAEGTSVGAGIVLECYANFGTWGVIGGFLLFGWLMARIDLRIMDCLEGGDQRGFVLWFLTGMGLMNPGGNLLEVVVTTASSAIAAYGLGYLLKRRFFARSTGDVQASRIETT